MSVITGREPGSEVALGLQLKHAARRALANCTTQGYAQMDTQWAKEFDQQLEYAAALRLVDLLRARRTGEKVAVGPGADRVHAGLDQVISTMDEDPALRTQIADEQAEAALLATQFTNLHLGTINHCMFDASQAECHNELPADQRGTAPLIGACQPDRCRNSVITRRHAPIWIAEEEDLTVRAQDPALSPPGREAVLIRLADVSAHHPRASPRRSHPLMPVSAKTATKLREAMSRLLAGEPLHTDGALTKENLAREAQVSHATVHRADDILAEWNAKVARPVLRTPGEVAWDETIAQLRKQLPEARAEITHLTGKLDALATVTANLYRENLALKKRDTNRRLAPLPSSE
ncbi:hypothetical protein [Streptomyces sp. NPDC058964]|uniref:hypothetical protein n=1 Tax=Streptomyces sp. NPDC058964 TaxID=3346681 RepID=UPI00368EC4A6